MKKFDERKSNELNDIGAGLEKEEPGFLGKILTDEPIAHRVAIVFEDICPGYISEKQMIAEEENGEVFFKKSKLHGHLNFSDEPSLLFVRKNP